MSAVKTLNTASDVPDGFTGIGGGYFIPKVCPPTGGLITTQADFKLWN
jgi:hypothetical protein